jgi:regulatory protein SWI5
METPHDRMMKHDPRPNRFSDDYDESMEETIKPVRGGHRSSQRNSGIFEDMRQQAENALQTPQRSNTMPIGYHNPALSTPDFMNLTNLNTEFVKIENGFDGTAIDMPPELCQQSSPMNRHMGGFDNGGTFDNRPELRHPNFDTHGMHMGPQSPSGSSPSHRGSPHRRTESIASITSAASIASINIEETKTETGVTLQEIAGFIEGPDPHDGKWVCLFDSCGKKFGRKENIKSHVQTHLNDRQYQCPTCKKCFVRQHDLKRHAKIHTGIKPYPCECGNSFARHDALTRHRQRGMCVGAFDGVVRKVVKRGRPRKHRPGMEDRREKRERTRRKNTSSTNSPSSASSQSGYSDSSAPNSPGNDFDGMLGDKEFPDMMGVAMGPGSAAMDRVPTSVTMDPTELSVSSAPMPTLEGSMDLAETLTVVTPEQIHSPSAMSSYSHRSHASIGGGGGGETAEDNRGPSTHPGSPAKSVASHYTHQPGTPPELSASSSPPAADEAGRFFNLDPNSSGLSDMSLGLNSGGSTGGGIGGMSGMSLDDDMLLFASEGGLVQLDRDMMLGAKYDEDYDAVTMFTNNDDVFFGSV